MSDLGKLYQRAILEHHQAPRHAGRLPHPTHSAEGHNPLCGDRVFVSLAIAEARLQDAACEVKGCAICRASGSMMAGAIIGLEVNEVRTLVERFLAAVARAPNPATDGASPATPAPGTEGPAAGATDASAASGPAPASAEEREWGELAALLEARRFPNRRRCASLSWEALQRALSG